MSTLTAYQKFIQQALKYGFSLYGTSKTGQITSYAANDDGAYQKGYPETGQRFVDNGDYTITDMATGLMWLKSISQLSATWYQDPNPTAWSWLNAISLCENLNTSGHNDWRLPNVKELRTIVDYSRQSPCVYPIFENFVNFGYHSSTTVFGLPAKDWVVEFTNGSVNQKNKVDNAYPRPVRLGVPA